MRRSRPELERALRARRQALRAKLRGEREKKRRRRWPWLLLALILALLALLQDCSCAPPPPGEAVEAVGAPMAPEPSPPPLTGRLDRRDRPDWAPPAPEPLPWLAAYRLQVAARSPRLAACFVGVDRPGALQWTATVEPASGLVSDHAIEPMLETGDLTAAQRACVIEVLSHPPYRLDVAPDDADPSRVGIAIEF